MSATAIVIKLLLQDAAVAGLVGQAVFAGEAPQEQVPPYLTVRGISEGADYVISGPSGAFDARVEVASHGRTFASSDGLGETVKDALMSVVNLVDALGTATIWKTPSDVSDFSRDRTLYRRIQDYRVRWWK